MGTATKIKHLEHRIKVTKDRVQELEEKDLQESHLDCAICSSDNNCEICNPVSKGCQCEECVPREEEGEECQCDECQPKEEKCQCEECKA